MRDHVDEATAFRDSRRIALDITRRPVDVTNRRVVNVDSHTLNLSLDAP